MCFPNGRPFIDTLQPSAATTCVISTTSLQIGSNIMVSGVITPSRSGVIVEINYTTPTGPVINRVVTSNSSGGFSDTYTPSEAGA